jgi:Xaa-Pro aminopeptidase
MPAHRLIELEWPEFPGADRPPQIVTAEYQARLGRLREGMARRRLSHVVVYADREHFANLQYLTGFEPRFEEACLVVRESGTPLVVVGNECVGYLAVSPTWRDGLLRHERQPSFSLQNQPRGGARPLREIFAGEGISTGSRVGCIGWKWFEAGELADPIHAVELPSFIVDELRDLAGFEAVENATDLLMHPAHGLRARASAAEIAYFEYAGARSGDAMRRMIFAIRDGATDFEVAQAMQYTGEPLNCHVTLVTGDTRAMGMSSPVGAVVRRGDPWAANVAYWGSNVCRAGWVARDERDLPASARDYVPRFAGRYFEVMGDWLAKLRVGTPGSVLHDAVFQALPSDLFGITLNAGHLVHMDEWLSTPVFPESSIAVASGMVFQMDVIPVSATYFSTRIEDGVAVADATLRAELARDFPGCWARCQARRRFMTQVLGFELAEELLPLSNIPGLVPPFLLDPRRVFALG